MSVGTSPSAPPPSSNDEESLVNLALALLDQTLHLLLSVLTSDEEMTRESKLIPGSTIGKHLRHLLDHFRILLDSHPPPPSHSASTPIVNYDLRHRHTPIESSRAACSSSIHALQSSLRALATSPWEGEGWYDREVTVRAETPRVLEFRSTFGRELWFTCHHAIHHMASLRVIAVGESALALPKEFGVAPSTLKHQAGENGGGGETRAATVGGEGTTDRVTNASG